MFGRGKSGKNADEVAEAVIDNESRDHDEAVSSDASAVVSASGPRDISEVGPDDKRIDLGALQVTGVPGLSLQVTVDETTKQVTMVTLVVEDAAVQVQAFAAPKTTGIWDDVRGKIMASVTDGGPRCVRHRTSCSRSRPEWGDAASALCGHRRPALVCPWTFLGQCRHSSRPRDAHQGVR
jgi:hypothetical protein